MRIVGAAEYADGWCLDLGRQMGEPGIVGDDERRRSHAFDDGAPGKTSGRIPDPRRGMITHQHVRGHALAGGAQDRKFEIGAFDE